MLIHGLTFVAALAAIPLARTSIELQPAAFGQRDADLATNGRDFLGVWRDERNARAPGEGALYVGRFDDEGRPVHPFGRRLADSGDARVASNGVDYLIAWSGKNVTHAQRIDRDGVPLAARQTIDDPRLGLPALLVSNGSTYLLVSRGRTFATLLGSDGGVLKKSFPLPGWPLAATAENGRYVVVSQEYDKGADVVTELVIDESGGMSRRVLARIDRDRALSSATFGGDGILLTGFSWIDQTRWLVLLDRDGGLHERPLPPLRAGFSDAFWDGSEFLVRYLHGDKTYTMDLIRVSRRGELLQPAPYRLTSTAVVPWRTGFATNGRTRLLLWSDKRSADPSDLLSRAGRTLAELTSLAAPLRIATFTRHPQIGAQIAASGAHQMAAWSNELHTRVVAEIDGMELTVGASDDLSPPAVAASERSFLVAWKEGANLLACRYAFDGSPLDFHPLLLGTGVTPLDHPPGIAADRTSFLVSAEAAGRIRVAQVNAATGGVNAFWQPAYPQSEVRRTVPLRVGPRWIVAYTYFHPPSSLSGLAAVDISSARPFTLLSLASTDGGDPSLSAAPAKGRATLVWATKGKLVLFQSTESGSLLENGSTLERDPSAAETALAWNGTEYVLAWTEQETLYAMRFNSELKPLDEAPVVIDSGGVTTRSQPSIAVTADGVIIAYSKRDEENGDAPRAFVRTLARLAR